mmetsp:Transcript_39056/g.114693  ORF Transcript_39056/g.114693 Transcript_39056/m.114693 type:complete len:200 (-) Transcript_39056:1640-2239(-)
MHDPIKRIASELAIKCYHPVSKTDTCVPHNTTELELGISDAGSLACARRLVDFVYAHDLILDPTDGRYLMGTPALSEYNIRMLLGPRVFLARLGEVNEAHFAAAAEMVEAFVFAAPVANLSQASPLLEAKLGWHVPAMPSSNRHSNGRVGQLADMIRATLGPTLRAMNAWDLKLYDTVRGRFEADMRRLTIGATNAGGA